jgi:hypothetical protein
VIPGRCYGDPRSAIVRSSFLKYRHQARLITSASLFSKNKKQYEKGNHQQNRQFHCHRTHCRTQHVLHAELCDEVK